MSNSVFSHPVSGQVVVGTSKASARFRRPTANVPPATVGTIADQVVTQGAGVRTVALGSYFSGTSLSFALQSAVAGVSIAGSVLSISDTTVLAAAQVVVVASSAYGPSVNQTFNREVRAPASAGTITLNAFLRDDVVFDLGTSAGGAEAWVPLSGTAGAGQVIEARAVSLDDFGLATTPWSVLATANGVGDYSGTLRFLSISNSRFRPEVRLQAAPATTAQGAKTFVVGHVGVDIGQSERYRIRASFYSQVVSAEAIIDIGDAVKQLAAPYRVGRLTPTAQQPFTVGVDALPVGLTRSGNTISVNRSTYDGAPFQHWYCPDTKFDVSDARFIMRRSKLEVVSDLTLDYFFEFQHNNGLGGFKEISHNHLVAKPGGLSFSAYLKETYTGAGTGLILPDMGYFFRNWCEGSVADAVKVGGGHYMENVFAWTWNVPGQNHPIWVSGTTYALGQFVIFNGNYFKSLVANNIGNQPPTGQTSNSFWQSWNPHSDGFNPHHGVAGGLTIARNLFLADFALVAGNTLTGSNNVLFRMDRDPTPVANQNKIDKTLIEENVVLREATAQSYAISLESGVNVVAPTIRGNRIAPTNAGNEGFCYPNAIPVGTEWTDNRRTTDLSVINTSLWPNMVAGSYTPSTEKCVQFASHDDAVINPVAYINSANRPTAGVAAMANTLISEYPGRRFALGAATKSGTSLSQLMNDSQTVRQLPHYIAFMAHLCPHGSQPGAITMCWQANDQALGLSFAENIGPMLFGEGLDGSPLTMPATLSQRTIDHTMAEVHGPFTRTRFLLCGPGARQPEEDMANADYRVALVNGNHNHSTMINYGRIRQEYRDMVASIGGQGICHPFVGAQGMNIFCAAPDGVHPSDHVDGLPLMGRYIGVQTLQGMGLLPDFDIKFDNVFYEPTGAYVEFWSSRGPIITGRTKRGLAPIPATYPHRTQVFGFEIGDTTATSVPAQSATIVAGRVRVAPIGAAFANGQKFAFARGGGTGVMQNTADTADRYDLQYPLVDLGFYKMDGLAVEAMPASSLLTASGIS
jgi:hypothetical protein